MAGLTETARHPRPGGGGVDDGTKPVAPDEVIARILALDAAALISIDFVLF